MYKVLKYFVDLQDNNHPYDPAKGDTYPRKGLEPSAERIAELSGADNLQKTPLIAEIKEKAAPAPKKAAKAKPADK